MNNLEIKKVTRLLAGILLSVGVASVLSGCLLAAAGAGAEAAYVATQEDRTTGEVIDDQRITATIKSKLLADQSVSGMDVNVDTSKGNVTLRGVLRTQAQVEKTVELARSVTGVKSISAELFVR